MDQTLRNREAEAFESWHGWTLLLFIEVWNHYKFGRVNLMFSKSNQNRLPKFNLQGMQVKQS